MAVMKEPRGQETTTFSTVFEVSGNDCILPKVCEVESTVTMRSRSLTICFSAAGLPAGSVQTNTTCTVVSELDAQLNLNALAATALLNVHSVLWLKAIATPLTEDVLIYLQKDEVTNDE